MESFHFLRPLWFLALLPLSVLLVLLWRRHLASRSWQAVVDAQLLPHLLIGTVQRRNPWSLAALALGGLLAITALAGPTWSKLQQPLFRRDSALVVVLDLSQSMNATDVAPSRLQMAGFKLRDLLAQRKEGDTALVVYAADPFTVTPLTNDSDNIARQLPSLTPDLMPAQGSRADRAISQAQQLLQQAGASHGDVLLITDGIDNTPAGALHSAVRHLTAAGYRLSVLGVGSADGAPIPLQNGGFLQDGSSIVIAKLDEQALAKLAAEGHGIYRHLNSANDSDTDALQATFSSMQTAQQAKQVSGMKSDQWREEGVWLLLPLLPLAALAFRRGYLLLLFFAFLIPLPRSAYALDWDGLWHTPDQQAAHAFDAHQPKEAASLFQDPQWRAAAHYRAGDYQATLDDLKGQTGAEADYNRGNALARLGKFPEALNAYQSALKKDPTLADAKYNRDLVQKWLQKDQQQKQQGNGGNKQGHQQPSNGKQQNSNGGKSAPQPDKSPQPGDNNQQNGQKEKAQQGDEGKQQAGHPANAGQEQSGQQAQQQQSTAASKDNSAAKSGKPSQGASANASQAKPQQPAPQQDNASALASSDQADSKTDPATEQWLRRIPDDPGGLWRRKFLYQYKRQYQTQQDEAKPW